MEAKTGPYTLADFDGQGGIAIMDGYGLDMFHAVYPTDFGQAEIDSRWATATLFVAAPDMLEAVQLAEAAIEDMMQSTGGALIVQDYGRLNDALLACRRAQVKAGVRGIGSLLREPSTDEGRG